MKVRICVVLAVVLFAGTFAAIADPIPPEFSPPCWDWGDGNFEGYWDYPGGTSWGDNSEWDLTGAPTEMILEIENLYVEDFTKMVWVQYDVQFSGGASLTGVSIEGDIDFIWGTDDVTETYLDGGEYETTYWILWELDPQPNRERVIWNFDIPEGGSVNLSNIYFSTMCVPEPGTVAMLAMGAVGVLGAIRHRRK